MRLVNIVGVIVPPFVGVAAALWTPLDLWYDMKEGLIAFLGFLAVALVQIMPMTANFLQTDRLTTVEAERLTQSLTRQQYYWMGLLSATIVAMVLLILGAALKERVEGAAPIFWKLDASALICFFIAASISFVLIKMLGLFEGIMSLHKLRGELVINAAKRDAAEKINILQNNAVIARPIIPEDYGQVIPPRH